MRVRVRFRVTSRRWRWTGAASSDTLKEVGGLYSWLGLGLGVGLGLGLGLGLAVRHVEGGRRLVHLPVGGRLGAPPLPPAHVEVPAEEEREYRQACLGFGLG